MPSMKMILKTAAICVGTMAVVNRVPQAKELVYGGGWFS